MGILSSYNTRILYFLPPPLRPTTPIYIYILNIYLVIIMYTRINIMYMCMIYVDTDKWLRQRRSQARNSGGHRLGVGTLVVVFGRILSCTQHLSLPVCSQRQIHCKSPRKLPREKNKQHHDEKNNNLIGFHRRRPIALVCIILKWIVILCIIHS